MTKRDKNRLRTRVLESLTPADQAAARAEWQAAWPHRRPGCTVADQQRARLAMLTAIDGGLTFTAAGLIARAELAKGA